MMASAGERGATPPPVLQPHQRLVSASTGALLTSLIVTPLDVVKVRMQAQAVAPAAATATFCHCGDFVFCPTSFELCDMPARVPPVRLNGTLDGISKIVQLDGVTALWRGLSASLAMSIPSTAIYFVGYDVFKAHLQEHNHPKIVHDYAPLIAGASSRAITAAIVAPVELVRTRLQSTEGRGSRGNLRAAMAGVHKLMQANGTASLWRGLSPTLWRDVPFSGLYWMGYDALRRHLQPPAADKPMTTGEDFLSAFFSGSAAGGVAAAVTTPFDVAKTRRQIDNTISVQGQGMPAILRRIANESGWRGLFRGISPRVLRTAPACAIMISSYEMGKRYFAETS